MAQVIFHYLFFKFRRDLMLTDVVRQTLKVALYLIGVEAPERM